MRLNAGDESVFVGIPSSRHEIRSLPGFLIDPI